MPSLHVHELGGLWPPIQMLWNSSPHFECLTTHVQVGARGAEQQAEMRMMMRMMTRMRAAMSQILMWAVILRVEPLLAQGDVLSVDVL